MTFILGGHLQLAPDSDQRREAGPKPGQLDQAELRELADGLHLRPARRTLQARLLQLSRRMSLLDFSGINYHL